MRGCGVKLKKKKLFVLKQLGDVHIGGCECTVGCRFLLHWLKILLWCNIMSLREESKWGTLHIWMWCVSVLCLWTQVCPDLNVHACGWQFIRENLFHFFSFAVCVLCGLWVWATFPSGVRTLCWVFRCSLKRIILLFQTWGRLIFNAKTSFIFQTPLSFYLTLQIQFLRFAVSFTHSLSLFLSPSSH